MFRMLVRLTGSREYVDDLAQEVFLRLHRALPSFRGDALLTTYLHRIVVNVAQDEWKRRQREDRRSASLSDDVSAWEERLAHPGPNAEQQLGNARAVGASRRRAGQAECRGTQRSGPLSSGGAKLPADCRIASPADRHGSDASSPRTQQAAHPHCKRRGEGRHERSRGRRISRWSALCMRLRRPRTWGVPDDFAARVMARVAAAAATALRASPDPAERSAGRPRTGGGRAGAAGCGACCCWRRTRPDRRHGCPCRRCCSRNWARFCCGWGSRTSGCYSSSHCRDVRRRAGPEGPFIEGVVIRGAEAPRLLPEERVIRGRSPR